MSLADLVPIALACRFKATTSPEDRAARRYASKRKWVEKNRAYLRAYRRDYYKRNGH